MDMEVTAWHSLHSTMNAQRDRRPFSRATLRRIAAFARPHRRALGWFLVLSTVTAMLAVVTPVLAGRVVDGIVGGAAPGTVLGLSGLIAVIAVAEAGLGLLTRRLSAGLGEGLILDLRTTVYDHVQRMPVAFFTRTRTGALVSRLNNDVIGAQRAFSDTLSSVVGNVVTLLLTLVVMLSLSWQITLIALVLLPVFVLPARRVGRRLAGLRREAADHNAAMGTQMTERFSAPGATLIKLFSAARRTSRRSSPHGPGGCATSGCASGHGPDGLRHRAHPRLASRRPSHGLCRLPALARPPRSGSPRRWPCRRPASAPLRRCPARTPR
ncbi:hypothetical protein SRIMM317S_06844 [Streptomyces rimosus subsp. rimosus]